QEPRGRGPDQLARRATPDLLHHAVDLEDRRPLVEDLDEPVGGLELTLHARGPSLAGFRRALARVVARNKDPVDVVAAEQAHHPSAAREPAVVAADPIFTGDQL